MKHRKPKIIHGDCCEHWTLNTNSVWFDMFPSKNASIWSECRPQNYNVTKYDTKPQYRRATQSSDNITTNNQQPSFLVGLNKDRI